MGSFGVVQESAKAELGLERQRARVDPRALAPPSRLSCFRSRSASWSIGAIACRLMIAACSNMDGWYAAHRRLRLISRCLVAARMLAGIGTTGALTCALSLCADLCAGPSSAGRAMLIVNLGKALGVAAAFALSGWLFGLFVGHSIPDWFGGMAPWRSTHLALAILSLLRCCLPLWQRCASRPRHEVESSPDAPFRIVAQELWSRRGFLVPLFAGQIAVVMADAAAGVWVAPVLVADLRAATARFWRLDRRVDLRHRDRRSRTGRRVGRSGA